MYTDTTAVTIQSNKIVSSEVKDNQALLEPAYGEKLNELFGQHNSYCYMFIVIFNENMNYHTQCLT